MKSVPNFFLKSRMHRLYSNRTSSFCRNYFWMKIIGYCKSLLTSIGNLSSYYFRRVNADAILLFTPIDWLFFFWFYLIINYYY